MVDLSQAEHIDDIMKAQKKREDRVNEMWKEWKEKERYLYLMKNDINSCYKIGVSYTCQYRETTLQSEEPTVKLVGKWLGLDKHEKDWHKYFEESHARGEWFNLNKVQVKFFTYRCVNKMGPPENKISAGRA